MSSIKFSISLYSSLVYKRCMKNRITIDPKILVGKPVITGTRIPVYLILNLLAHGKTINDIVEDYPELTKEDVQAAIAYAASHMEYEETRTYETEISR